MKRLSLACVFVVLSALSAWPQSIAIHGHPQKTEYTSPAEWPFWSAQCHWMNDGVMSHTHIEGNWPIYMEVNPGDNIVVPFTIVTFHGGKVTTLWSENARITLPSHPLDPVYLNPVLQGDRLGVTKWQATATFNMTKSQPGGYAWSKHGWTELRVSARTSFPNGTGTTVSFEFPAYSLMDTTIAEIPYPEGRVHPLRASCSPSPEGPGTGWGLMVTEFAGSKFVPIAPLALGQTWDFLPKTYSYGVTTALPPGTFDRRLDPDLHNGISGTQVTSPFGFDTNVSGLGTHKLSFIWDAKAIKPDGTVPTGFKPDDEAAALLVGTLVIADGTTCLDPTATNNGGLLPCVYPPPPPPPLCAGLTGQTATVTIGSVPFKVTVTSDTCAATVATF